MENLRKEYNRSILNEEHLVNNPMDQFKIWFDEAVQSEIHEPNAMILSTVDLNSKPSSRVVLLKKMEEQGFVFFTNYLSRKGRELHANAHACLLFYWDILERQIRIEGVVKQLDTTISDTYFYSRPLLSQIGSMISPQSQIIEHRKELQDQFKYYEAHPNEIKRPDHWGGYLLLPDYFEFWQGRESRLHDRLTFTKMDDSWKIARLAP